MEAEVGRDDVLGRPGLALRGLAQVGHRLLEPGQVERPAAAEDADRDPDLDRLARHVDVEPVARREGEDEGAAVQLVLREALLHELADRLAHRAAARAERVGEVDLAQVGPLRDGALDDRVAQQAVRLLDRGGVLEGGEAPVVADRSGHEIRPIMSD